MDALICANRIVPLATVRHRIVYVPRDKLQENCKQSKSSKISSDQ